MSTNTPKLAILGASGFVGSALVERLYFDDAWRDRFEFTAFIRGFGNAARLARLPIRIERLDLTDYPQVQAALSGYDYVVNCTRGDTALMMNGLKNTARAMKTLRTRKFVHLGSVAIYGEDPPAESARENAPPNPVRTEYGNIKAAQDELVFALHQQGVPSMILCPSNIGGPYSDLILDAVARLSAGEIVLVDEGRYPTNIVHVDNLVQAVLAALASDTGWGERYFVNETEPTTWKQFFEDLVSMLGTEYEFAGVSREEVVQQMSRQKSRTSAGIKSQVGTLVSSEFREAVSVLPAFRAMDDGAKRLFRGLSPRMQERIRRRLARPIVVPQVRSTRSLDHKLITAQIRRVYHSPQKAMDRLQYAPLLDYRQGMDTTRKWLEFANRVPVRSHPGVEPGVK